MTKKMITTVLSIGLFSLSIAVSSGIASENGMSGSGSCDTQIESGRDFGQHVKEHNKMFSGDHNPGKHHKGYSGIK
jgi:hypothetical protein